MRSRLAILGMLVLGMVLSTGGAGLAVSGFASQNDNAAERQYGQPPGGGDDDVLGEEESGGRAGGGGGGTLGEQDDSGAQPARQAEAGAQAGGGGEQLPFTGFAAIPILLGGVARSRCSASGRRCAGGCSSSNRHAPFTLSSSVAGIVVDMKPAIPVRLTTAALAVARSGRRTLLLDGLARLPGAEPVQDEVGDGQRRSAPAWSCAAAAATRRSTPAGIGQVRRRPAGGPRRRLSRAVSPSMICARRVPRQRHRRTAPPPR